MPQSFSTGFPVFTVVNGGNDEFLVGGGGGATKAGVKNSVILLEITKDFKIKPKTDIVFPATDDACMNLAAHPTHKVFVASVNSSEEIIKAGNNINGRYLFTKGKVIKTEPSKNIRTIDSRDTMHYQKCSRFSQDGKIYTAGTSTGQFTTWKWPEMEQTGSMEFKKEIAEISIQGNLAIVTTAGTLSMVALDKAKIRTALDIGKASITPSEFRSAFFGLGIVENFIFAVLNASDKKGAQLQMYSKEWKLKRSKWITNKPITAVAISQNGELLAVGTADFSVEIHTTEFKRMTRIANVHSFAVTAIDFNSRGTVVLSGSADGTVALIKVPEKPDTRFRFVHLMMIVVLIVILLMAFMEHNEGDEL